MDSVTIVGIVASICTAMSTLPQLFKLLKEKTAEGISIFMLMVLFAGVGTWIIYGVLKKDWIIIISNSCSLIINVVLTILTLKYKRNSISG
ncbi:MAG: SemiSWEET transporter [Ferruginibacter sp.]|nr:SemiSWEET transporter [Ferruginibacter sp.]